MKFDRTHTLNFIKLCSAKLLAIALCLMACVSSAVADSRVDFRWSSMLDDNAGINSTNEKVKDIESQIGLIMKFSWDNSYVDAQFDYDLNKRMYYKQDEFDSNDLEGDSKFVFGSAKKASFEVSHNAMRVLQESDSINRLSNTVNRDMFVFKPAYRIKLGRGTSLKMGLSSTSILFEDIPQLDRDIYAVNSQFSRQVGKTASYGFRFQSKHTNFYHRLIKNTSLQSLSSFYRGSSARLRYSIDLGITTYPDNNETDILAESKIEYVGDSNGLTLSYKNMVTDSAQSEQAQTGGNSLSIAGLGENVRLLSSGISYYTNALCRGCTLRINLEQEDYKYNVSADESFMDVSAGESFMKDQIAVNFNYRLNDTTSLNSRISENETRYPNNSDRNFSDESIMAGVSFIFKKANIKLQASKRSRLRGQYDETGDTKTFKIILTKNIR